MQLEQILMDKDGREIAERGTPLFPLSVYDNDMSAFSSHFVPWHWHSECELVYVTSGKLLLETPGNRTVLELGSCAFMNANTLHAMRPGSDERCCMVTVVFDADVLGGPPSSIFQTRYVLPVLRNAGFPACILNTGASWEREVLDLLAEIHSVYDKCSFGLELKLRSLLSEVWLLLMANAEIDPEKAVEPDPYIKNLLSFITPTTRRISLWKRSPPVPASAAVPAAVRSVGSCR
ncbi:MAG: cupin domain-containing protein [Clostridia bacterium]|nr:cupin domain-containing protein [Clostridia bacterium]